MPPCGGVPYSSASRKKPKRARASSSLMPSDAKDLLLHVLAVNADRSRTQLEAVHRQVVAVGAHAGRVADQVRHVGLVGRGERVVRRHPFAVARSYSNIGKSVSQMGQKAPSAPSIISRRPALRAIASLTASSVIANAPCRSAYFFASSVRKLPAAA